MDLYADPVYSFLLVFLLLIQNVKAKPQKECNPFLRPVILFVRDDIAMPNIGVKYSRFMPIAAYYVLFHSNQQFAWFNTLFFQVGTI